MTWQLGMKVPNPRHPPLIFTILGINTFPSATIYKTVRGLKIYGYYEA